MNVAGETLFVSPIEAARPIFTVAVAGPTVVTPCCPVAELEQLPGEQPVTVVVYFSVSDELAATR